MYRELYEYLILHGQLVMPGIGSLCIERKPAAIEFTHKQINPSSYSISLQPTNLVPSKKLFNWLAERFGISYHDAIVRFNGFALDMKKEVLSGRVILWNDVGTFSKGSGGEIQFESALSDQTYDSPVSAVRVIREKAVHTVKVGEDERTSVEMTELLNPVEERRTNWWVPALIVGIVLVIITTIYFLQKGWSLSSIGNQQKLAPAAPAAQR